MKSFAAKILAPILAFLMLFSTFSFTVEQHFCGDILVDVSYFGNAKKCGTETNVTPDEPSVKMNSCCKDEVQYIVGQDELQKVTFSSLEIPQQQFIVAFTISYHDLFKNLEREIVPHKTYPPPDIITDIQVLHEVFII